MWSDVSSHECEGVELDVHSPIYTCLICLLALLLRLIKMKHECWPVLKIIHSVLKWISYKKNFNQRMNIRHLYKHGRKLFALGTICLFLKYCSLCSVLILVFEKQTGRNFCHHLPVAEKALFVCFRQWNACYLANNVHQNYRNEWWCLNMELLPLERGGIY